MMWMGREHQTLWPVVGVDGEWRAVSAVSAGERRRANQCLDALGTER